MVLFLIQPLFSGEGGCILFFSASNECVLPLMQNAQQPLKSGIYRMEQQMVLCKKAMHITRGPDFKFWLITSPQ
jgi:hypothetical protein